MSAWLKEIALVLQEIYDKNPGPTWQDGPGLTHVFTRTLPDGMPLICFEGTLNTDEWISRDFDLLGWSTFHHPVLGPLHSGLAYGVDGVVDKIGDYLERIGWPPYALGGHSKGAGEALIAAGVLTAKGHAPALVRAYEPPRVGTERLAQFLAPVDIVATATLNAEGMDLVTLVPSVPPWKHTRDPLVLRVPDSLSVVAKHKLPAVLAAL